MGSPAGAMAVGTPDDRHQVSAPGATDRPPETVPGAVDSPGRPREGTIERADQPAPANETNGTKHHANPENTSGQGSRSDIANWLVASMADRFADGAINLSQGQYETAQSILGEGFGSDLDRYVDVAGETDTDSDDETAEQLNETRQIQQEFTDSVREFRRTYREYQRAREQNRTNDARRLARELETLSDGISGTATNLTTRYDRLENRTGVSFQRADRTVESVTDNVTATAEAVVAETLVETRIRLATVSRTASFRSPMLVEGQYLAANGSAIPGSVITLATPTGGTSTRTAANGTFRLTYRPVALRTGDRTLSVRATQENTSIYQSAVTSVSTTIEPVEATLQLADVPDRVTFGDAVAVDATLSVDGRPIPGVPITVELDGVTLATATSSASGRIAVSPSLPAAVSSGTVTLSAAVDWTGRAIQADPARQRLVVASTPTTLSIVATNGSDLRVSGRLHTADGTGVPGQRIAIRVDGATVTTVATNASGGYAATLGNGSVPTGQAVPVTARYDGEGSNLESARASTVGRVLATAPAGDVDTGGGGDGRDGGSSGLAALLPLALGAVVTVVIAVVAVVVLRRRRSETAGAGSTPGPAAADAPADADGVERDLTLVEALIAERDWDASVVALYDFLQTRFLPDADAGLTPRERFEAVRDSLSPTEASLFEQVTSLYERAQFAPTSVGAEEVKETLVAVKDVLVGGSEADDQPDPSSDD